MSHSAFPSDPDKTVASCRQRKNLNLSTERNLTLSLKSTAQVQQRTFVPAIHLSPLSRFLFAACQNELAQLSAFPICELISHTAHSGHIVREHTHTHCPGAEGNLLLWHLSY